MIKRFLYVISIFIYLFFVTYLLFKGHINYKLIFLFVVYDFFKRNFSYSTTLYLFFIPFLLFNAVISLSTPLFMSFRHLFPYKKSDVNEMYMSSTVDMTILKNIIIPRSHYRTQKSRIISLIEIDQLMNIRSDLDRDDFEIKDIL